MSFFLILEQNEKPGNQREQEYKSNTGKPCTLELGNSRPNAPLTLAAPHSLCPVWNPLQEVLTMQTEMVT